MPDRMRADRAGVPWREFGMDAIMRKDTTRKCKATITATDKTAG
jgi:hypothetical protein